MAFVAMLQKYMANLALKQRHIRIGDFLIRGAVIFGKKEQAGNEEERHFTSHGSIISIDCCVSFLTHGSVFSSGVRLPFVSLMIRSRGN